MIFAQDDFSEADGTALNGKSLDVGGTWQAAQDFTLANATVQSGRAVASAQNNIGYASGTPDSADYTVTGRFRVLSNPSGQNYGVAARVQVGAKQWYTVTYNGSKVWVYKNAASQVGSAVNVTLSTGQDYDITIDVTGSATTTIKGRVQRASDSQWLTAAGTWQDEQVDAISTSDSSSPITSAGKAGIWLSTSDGTSTGMACDSFVASTEADATAPVLSSPVGTTTGSTTATIGATTDEGNGTLYGVVTTSSTAPSAAQIKAGQDHTGAAAAFAGNAGVGSTGAKTISATGLTASTAYYAHLMHEDAATNQSNIVTSAEFTTDAGPVTVAVTDANWFFSPYNWIKSGSTYAQTNNPGAYFKTSFTGTSCKLNLDVSPLTDGSVSANDYPTILYSVDGGAFTRRQLLSSDTQITVATGLADTTHQLVCYFVGADWDSYDRWTTPVMCLRVTGLEIDAGKASAAPTLYSGRMICFGDSHSEGWEALAAGVSVANMDASQATPLLLGRAFECEVGVVAFAGQGYTAAVASANVPDLEDAWDFYYSGQSRLSAGALDPAPDYIVSLHGQNDSAGAGLRTAVANCITAWRAAAPTAKILVCLPPDLENESDITTGETNAADASSYLIDHSENLLAGAYKLGSHLSVRGHARFAATLTRLISTSIGGGYGAEWYYRHLQG